MPSIACASVACSPSRLAARRSQAQPSARMLLYSSHARHSNSMRCGKVAAAADSGGEPAPDAGAAFLEQFKSLSTNPADILGTAQTLDTSAASSGCCGGSSSASEQSGSGCCGSSSSSGAAGAAGDQQAATAVMNQLSSMMGGMEGSLTRDDFRSAFDDTPSAASSEEAASGERFLDVRAILSSRGQEGGDDYDAELDALVV